MRPETRILVGLALIGAGGAALVGMNIWTVRPFCAHRADGASVSATSDVSVAPTAARRLNNKIRTLASTSAVNSASAPSASVVPSASAEIPVHDAGPADAAGTSDAGTGSSDTIRIVFASGSSVPTKEMIPSVQKIASRLARNFRMKVVLVGHGDDASDPDTYIRLGRRRASAVLRMLVDYGLSMSRIAVESPRVEDGRVVTGGVAPGTVQVRVEPRFLKKDGKSHAP